VTAARDTAESLEAQLNAFDEASAVSHLDREGEVVNEHVARIVRRGDNETPPTEFDTGTVRISRLHVTTDVEVDLNGLTKGYVVDWASEALAGLGRRGVVSGGDMSPPTGPVGIESPYGDETPLKTLDTNWHVATSGGCRRSRNARTTYTTRQAGRSARVTSRFPSSRLETVWRLMHWRQRSPHLVSTRHVN